MKKVYDKLEELRLARKLSKTDIANDLEITRQGYENMMKNDTMTLRILAKVANIFNIPIKSLFEEEKVYEAPEPAPLQEIIKAQRETIDTQKMLIEELRKNK
jgi:transcriptional regulator with XRE-family HTH domain